MFALPWQNHFAALSNEMEKGIVLITKSGFFIFKGVYDWRYTKVIYIDVCTKVYNECK